MAANEEESVQDDQAASFNPKVAADPGGDDDDESILQFGTAGSHPASAVLPLLVAPTTTNESNTLGLDISVVACLSLRDLLFQFGSSFVVHTEGVRRVLQRLPGLRRLHSSKTTGELPPISVFGHADPVGDEEFNKQLSGRRAKAILGLLTHNVAMWDDLFNNPLGDDNWRTHDALGTIASALGISASQPRDQLFKAYMQSLCPFVLGKDDFLGHGSDPGGKADFQGCGKFNPVVLLSTTELEEDSKEERDEANQPNRRVVLFLFRPGLRISANLWPCPKASEPTAGCRKRFFPDGAQRIKPGPVHREFNSLADDPPGNTFACRFYDRIAHKSPCEGILRSFRIRLFDLQANFLPGAPFRIDTDSGRLSDAADQNGDATFVSTFPRRVKVLWNRPAPDSNGTAAVKPASFEFSKEVFVTLSGDDLPDPELDPDPPPVNSDNSVPNLVDPPGTPNFPPPPPDLNADLKLDRVSDRRLSNLGFPKIEPDVDRVRRYQRESEVEETGKLTDIQDDLEKRHTLADPPSRYKAKGGVVTAGITAPAAPAAPAAPLPAGATPANPGIIDEALDAKQAVIYSPNAPRDGVKESEDKQADDRAVWTYIPAGFSIDAPEALVYFHGNNNFVRAKLVSGAIKPRPPAWAPANVAKPNAGVVYGFDKVDGLSHQPVEMLPEVGVASTGKFWATEPAGKLLKPPALGKMIDNVLDRLSKLPQLTGGKNYLSKQLTTKDLKRLFVMGHSGGTIPINAAAASDVVFSVITDLVPFDRSFGENTTPYFNFCKFWNDKGQLGNGDDKSRFISFYGPPSPDMGPHGEVTSATGSTLYHTLMQPAASKGLGFTGNLTPVRVPQKALPDGTVPAIVWPATDMVYIDHHTDNPAIFKKDPSDPKKSIMVSPEKPPSSGNLDGIREALKQNFKAIFVFTNVAHDFIPLAFTPPVLEYKRGAAPVTKPGFTLNVLDPNNKPLSGAKVKVFQEGAQVFAGVVPASGAVFVENNNPGLPCTVEVEGFGLVGREGAIALEEADDGTVPPYDPGSAVASLAGCGGEYHPPTEVA